MMKLMIMAALAATHAEAPQRACLARADVSDMIVVLMPYFIDKARERCSSHLDGSSFLTGPAGAAFTGRLRGESEARRTAAARAFRAIGGERAQAGLSDETIVRMMGEAMATDLAGSINRAQCRDFNELLEAMSTMSADQLGRLGTALFSLAGVGGGRTSGPEICPA